MKKVVTTMRFFFLVLCCILQPSILFAQLKLPSIFSDGMVLQQNSVVNIWGTAENNAPVKVTTSWNNETIKVTPSNSGEWSCQVTTPAADFKHHSMSIKQKRSEVEINNILMGEVWFCAGQSNMEMEMKGYYSQPILGAPEAILNAKNSHIRLFKIPKHGASTPQDNCDALWNEATPTNVGNFSATAYFFGNQLHQSLRVPVALVAAPWGAASIQSYMSKEALRGMPNITLPKEEEKEIKNGNQVPTAIYNGMIAPVVGYGIKGMIWYQGESNRNDPEGYPRLFKSFLNDWRKKWAIGDFDIHFAQIAPFSYAGGNSAYIREAQQRCMKENKGAYMISLLDIGEEWDIHPMDKKSVGFRLAQSALSHTYDIYKMNTEGPIYKSFEVKNKQAVVSFEKNDELTDFGKKLDQFELAGEDRVFYPAKAYTSGRQVRVYCDEVPEPKAVRYAFKDWTKGTLYNTAGAAASSFRSDDWKEETTNLRPVDLVYPHLDSENSRWFFFSSACRPFGMVNLSPDNEIDGAWGSGYRYNTDTIKGFSHVHAWQLSALSVMPVVVNEGNKDGSLYKDFYSAFKHSNEKVTPGFHKVHLDRYNIDVELTSTKRVGFHQYRFLKLQEQEEAAVLLNLNTPLGPAANKDGIVIEHNKNSIVGKLTCASTSRRPKPVQIYFELLFDKPISKLEKDENTGNYLVFFKQGTSALKMKAAISYTSADNAKINMAEELPGWDFNAVVKDSREEWNSMLSRIKVKTTNLKARRRFYTDLWHSLQGRRIISDVNGSYPDNTGDKFRIGQIPLDKDGKPEFNQYNSDSFWGAQWTITTLWQLVYPEIAEEFVQSMLTYYKDGGLIPRGPSGGNYTYVMTGASSTPFIVGAYQKGIRGFDIDLAYEGLKKNHLLGGIMAKAGYEHKSKKGGALEYYINMGYAPYPNPVKASGGHQNGAGQTLEYAYQDWTLAQFAKALGKDADARHFEARSGNYKNVYDAKSGWMRPKDVKGKWFGGEDYDPYNYAKGFVESNAAQMTWFVPHDLQGLAKLMGGEAKAVEKLDAQFREASKLNFTSGTSHSQETHPEYKRIPINYGNQPSMQTAFVFNQLNRPDLTQYWSREVVEKAFSGLATNTGYNGDEDQGLMGSLAVLYKLGLFQMNGGTDVEPYYDLGSTIFDEIVIKLNPNYYDGDQFTIKANNNSSSNRYIKSATLNGEPVQGVRILHRDLVNGGELRLEMTDK